MLTFYICGIFPAHYKIIKCHNVQSKPAAVNVLVGKELILLVFWIIDNITLIEIKTQICGQWNLVELLKTNKISQVGFK